MPQTEVGKKSRMPNCRIPKMCPGILPCPLVLELGPPTIAGKGAEVHPALSDWCSVQTDGQILYFKNKKDLTFPAMMDFQVILHH